MEPDRIAAIIAAARRCLGTPFHHQGRQPRHGIDCIGLIVVALRAIGLTVHDHTNYSRRPDGKSLLAALTEHGAKPVSKIQPGDILLFRYDNQPQHVALATEPDRMIHSFAVAGEVVETIIGDYWRRRLNGIYRFAQAESTAQHTSS